MCGACSGREKFIQEMKQQQVIIKEISGIGWPGPGQITVDDHLIHFSAEKKTHRMNVVSIVIHKGS